MSVGASISREVPSMVKPCSLPVTECWVNPAADKASRIVSVTPLIGPARVFKPAAASARSIVSVIPLTSNRWGECFGSRDVTSSNK